MDSSYKTPKGGVKVEVKEVVKPGKKETTLSQIKKIRDLMQSHFKEKIKIGEYGESEFGYLGNWRLYVLKRLWGVFPLPKRRHLLMIEYHYSIDYDFDPNCIVCTIFDKSFLEVFRKELANPDGNSKLGVVKIEVRHSFV